MRSFVVVAALLALGTGCGAARPLPSSRTAFTALADALRRDDGAATVYAMLPASERAALPFADFARRWDATRVDRERTATAVVAAVLRDGPTAEVAAGGRGAVLVEESAGWRVGEPGVGAPVGARAMGRAGVRAALRGVHDALQRRDFVALLGLLSGRLRGSVEAELATIASATQDPAALEVLEIPGPTRVRLPDGRVIVLVWEEGQWRVDDVVGP